MQIHSLGLDLIYEDKFSLIAIHTTIEDYKLAYLLNKNLSICFCKTENELTFENKKRNASFSVFKYENTIYEHDLYLIENSSITENTAFENQLLLTSESKTYLIPEKNKVDFFIKITGEVNPAYIVKTISKINTIEQIITSYSIDKNTLKSKDYLIF